MYASVFQNATSFEWRLFKALPKILSFLSFSLEREYVFMDKDSYRSLGIYGNSLQKDGHTVRLLVSAGIRLIIVATMTGFLPPYEPELIIHRR